MPWIALLIGLGCGATDPAPSTGPRVGDLPPPPGPAARTLAVLARHYHVGLVRCPVDTLGRMARPWGSPRDALRALNPSYLMMIPAAGEAPWDPLYDVAVAEDGWVTFLAEPGSTHGLLRPFSGTLALSWPEARADATVTCTDIRPVPRRALQVEVHGPPGPAALVGCGDALVVRTGEIVPTTYDVPCTLWAEAPGYVSRPVRLDAVLPTTPVSADPVDLVLEPDLRWAGTGLTDRGRVDMQASLDDAAERMDAHLTALDGLIASAEDRDVAKQLGRYRLDQSAWLGEIRRLRARLP